MTVFQIQKENGLLRVLKSKDDFITPALLSTINGLRNDKVILKPIIITERGLIIPNINFESPEELNTTFEDYQTELPEWALLIPRLSQNFEKLKDSYNDELELFITRIKQLSLPEAFGFLYDPISDPETYLLDILNFEPSIIAIKFPPVEKLSANKLIGLLFNTRKIVPPNIALYLPGGVPIGYQTLLFALGIDILDEGAVYRSAASNITYSDGFYAKCKDGTLLVDLIEENLSELRRDFKAIKNSIENDTVWTRIARDMHAFPNVASAVKIFSKEYLPLISKSRFSSLIKTRLNFTGDEGLYHPDVVKYQEQLLNTYKISENKKLVVLLPCSAKKPYRDSKSHKIFEKTIKKASKRNYHQIEIWSLTSPIGVVPRDLESVYPAGFYDLPVTGDWSQEESQIMGNLLENMLLKVPDNIEVIVHISEGYRKMVKVGTEKRKAIFSWIGKYATSREAQLKLGQEIETYFEKELKSETKRSKYAKDTHKEINNIIRYTHGKNIFINLSDTKSFGRPPRPVQIKKNNDHLLSWDQINGRVILSPNAAIEIADHSTNWILTDTDELKGSTLFNVGVLEASENISPGDEVLIFNADKQVLLGIGQAQISGYSMNRVEFGIGAKIKKKCVMEVKH